MTSKPIKPLPPASGIPADLLEHAVRYGAYCQQLENKLSVLDKWRTN